MLECYFPDGTDRGKGSDITANSVKKRCYVSCRLTQLTLSALGDLTCTHETGGLRIILFSKIGNKISFFWISKLGDGDRIFFASLLGRLENESGI